MLSALDHSLHGCIDVPRPPSYRSGWGRLPSKVSHDEYITELRSLRVFLSYGGETQVFHWFIDRETAGSAGAQAITRRLCRCNSVG